MTILVLVGVIDLVATACLHASGQIVELNPVMRPLIDDGEWLFALVKGLTLLGAYLALVRYAVSRPRFVDLASRLGILLYASIWLIWFAVGAFAPTA